MLDCPNVLRLLLSSHCLQSSLCFMWPLQLAAETLSGARVIPAVLQLRIVLGMLIPGSKPVSKAKGRFTSLTAMLANFANLTTQTVAWSAV